ncbi:hypothetical protein VVD49_08420 [Uliginosibacterium sp. H3]|uniref:PEGA domain-containing protein n=1 Tax=Uliginosibacterium silvisoli TaxID=3114758 RepID=A0ABU6K3C8_9RHOO|nr:hypothetical protein [Uliginosibacterium sp. H3]
MIQRLSRVCRPQGLVFGLLFGVVPLAHAQQSPGTAAIRFLCDGDSLGAEVSINGKFRGECPFDATVPEGVLNIRAVKASGADRERVFEQQTRVGEGTIKRLEIVLGLPQLTAAAKVRETQRLEAERVAREQVEQRERERLEQAQRARAERERELRKQMTALETAAAAGDVAAMLTLGGLFETGVDGKPDMSTARSWYGRAADAGSRQAVIKLTRFGVPLGRADADALAQMLALPTEPVRNVAIRGKDAVREFVLRDAFFVTPGGNRKFSFDLGSANEINRGTCRRNDNGLFDVESESGVPQIVNSASGTYLLGGLLNLEWRQGGLFGPRNSLTVVESTWGQPFPLQAGKRFGLKTRDESSKLEGDMGTRLDCGLSANEPGPRGGRTMICMREVAFSNFTQVMVLRAEWDEPSGCLSQRVVAGGMLQR